MSYNLAISPDFKPDLISGWFIFNTWFQKQLGEAIHLEIHQDFKEQYDAINNEKVDLIYANPFDISRLVRDKGFIPIAKPIHKPDEAIIACLNDSYRDISDLPSSVRVAQTDTPEVNTIGQIMLEPADITKENIEFIQCENFVIVAKQLLKKDADIGFFLASSFNDLSPLIQRQLYPIVNSQIHLIHHAFLISPKFEAQKEQVIDILVGMHMDEKGKQILAEIDIDALAVMEDEDAEFMIDLMDTLTT